MQKFFVLSLFLSLSEKTYAIDIYQYIIWKRYSDESGQIQNVSTNEFQKFLGKKRLKPIRVIYHSGFLTNGKPDPQKIKQIAAVSQKYPHIPVSFDIEIGNKFKPQTVLPIVNQTLNLYHQYGGAAPVGVYGILPQSIFGSEYMHKNIEKEYISLNKNYESIAQKVDILSPVIYNLWFRDFNEWKRRVDHQLSESQSYAKKYNLKIIPYFSSTYLDKKYFKNRNNIIYPLTEQEMTQRLNYIRSKKVDGVIIWDPSGGILSNGNKPVFDINKGAAKAILDFANDQ
ncbi:hypothetical protein [Acinetobacter vivianii]|uniref:hypothetical protein n=1 Tax=Acinetobacter vivianii TaxID=1776742 RepID=UPI002DB7F170|nr:hypothetical protein [Acinetobacter vivianii]MEB6481007.1 hypothetical protein [Acinetobacter vivianii]MEB6659291.1 hypothetical protein [Acinetobacter vivianii]